MAFEPDIGQPKCPYSGRTQVIPEVTAPGFTLQEHDLAAFIDTNRTQLAELATTVPDVYFPGCLALPAF